MAVSQELPQDTQAFLRKWRERWPHWQIALPFVPRQQQLQAEAWFALLAEWRDAALAGEDATPGLAKLAWWQEELRGWSNGVRRHPLGAVLQKQPVHWQTLADALPALRHREQMRGEPAQALAALQPFAQAAAQAENALWPSTAIAPESWAHLWLAEAAVRGQLGHATHFWHERWPQSIVSAAPARRAHAALLRLQVADAQRGRASSIWRSLWMLWKAARN